MDVPNTRAHEFGLGLSVGNAVAAGGAKVSSTLGREALKWDQILQSGREYLERERFLCCGL